MSRRFRTTAPWVAVGLALALAGPARAAAPAPVDTLTTAQRRALEWGLAGGLFAGSLALDGSARDELYLDSHGRYAPETRAFQRFGEPEVAFPVLAGMYGIGRWTDRPEVSRRAWEGAVALGTTAAATTLLKIGIGRERPGHGGGPETFRAGSSDPTFHSFPSGHTAAAFSLATTLSEAAHRRWVTALSYGLAGGVGWARVQGDHHWLSDVVGGAILGTATTRATLRGLDALHGPGEGAAIEAGPGGFVLRVPVP